MTTLEQLNTIFQTVFDDDDIKIAPEMTANDVNGWDSLSHVNLIVAIETKSLSVNNSCFSESYNGCGHV